MKQNLLDACKILVNLGLDSGPFGNLSVRVPGEAAYFQNPNGVIFDQLSISDILKVSEDGAVLEGDQAPHPGEIIHREIYRLRPDVNAIVHTHSPNTVALSLLQTTIEPFTQLGASLYQDQGLYLGFTGPVRDLNEGKEIAKALAKNSIVIAKNHGIFAVGPDLPMALWNFVVSDWAARVHLDARRLGLTQAESLDESSLRKSRVEVREKQAATMWKNYKAALKSAHLTQEQ